MSELTPEEVIYATRNDQIGGTGNWLAALTPESCHNEALRINASFGQPMAYTVELVAGFPFEVERRCTEFFVDGEYAGHTSDYSVAGVTAMIAEWAEAMEE